MALDIEGRPRDPKDDAKLHPDLAHPDPPRNVVKPCEAKAGCVHLHGHEGRCRHRDDCLCDLEGHYCAVHERRNVREQPRAPGKFDTTLPDHLLKEKF